jgi:hypothetical protein
MTHFPYFLGGGDKRNLAATFLETAVCVWVGQMAHSWKKNTRTARHSSPCIVTDRTALDALVSQDSDRTCDYMGASPYTQKGTIVIET